MSCGGKSSDATARRSPCGFSPKFASYVTWAYLSQSEEKTHSAPADSKANRIPPIPQNKSTNFGRFTLLHRTCEPKITHIGPNASEALLEISIRLVALLCDEGSFAGARRRTHVGRVTCKRDLRTCP